MQLPPSMSLTPAEELVAEKKALPEPEVWSPATWVVTPLLTTEVGVPKTKLPVEQVLEGLLAHPPDPLSKSSSAAQAPPGLAMVMEIESAPESPPLSVTEAVMVWTPRDRELVEKLPPEPMAPSRLEVQEMEPLRLPSSASVAVPEKPRACPEVEVVPFAGAVMETWGAVLPPPPEGQMVRSSRPASMRSPPPGPSAT